LERADTAAASGDLDKTITVLENALSYDPRDTTIAARLAEVLIADSQNRRAFRVLEDIPEDAPRDSRHLNLRARLLAQFNRLDKAVRVSKALQISGSLDADTEKMVLQELASACAKPDADRPLPASWQAVIADHQIQDGHLTEAAEWLAGLPDSDPDRIRLAGVLLEQVMRNQSLTITEHMARLAQEDTTPSSMLVLRRYRTDQKAWADVAALEEQFLTQYPDHQFWPEVAMASAVRLLRSGDPQAARALTDRLVFLNPNDVEALNVRGFALKSVGYIKLAREAFELALGIDPNNSRSRAGLSALQRPDKQASNIQIDLDVRGMTTRSP
jgi:Flp pilus assembly protein TadD